MQPILLERARRLLSERFGLEFPSTRDDDLSAGLASVAARLALPDITSLLDELGRVPWDNRGWGMLAACVTVGETSFFRNAHSFRVLSDHVLMPLIAERRRLGYRMLRLWSAGCASGEEAYSLAMLVDRLLPDREQWLISIFASDINPEALVAARAASYREWSLRETPAEIRARYFRRREDRFELRPEITQMVTIAPVNLAADFDREMPSAAGAIDLIVCRNVLMYLGQKVREAVARRLVAALAPGGWLFTNPAEAAAGLFAPLRPAIIGDTLLFRVPPMTDHDAGTRVTSRPEAMRRQLRVRPQPQVKTTEPAAEGLDAVLSRLQSLADRGFLDEARRGCEAAAARHGLSAELHRLRAAVCIEQDDVDAAVEAQRCVIFLLPEDAAAHFVLGRLLCRKGATTQAARALRAAVRLARQTGLHRTLTAALAELAELETAMERRG